MKPETKQPSNSQDSLKALQELDKKLASNEASRSAVAAALKAMQGKPLNG